MALLLATSCYRNLGLMSERRMYKYLENGKLERWMIEKSNSYGLSHNLFEKNMQNRNNERVYVTQYDLSDKIRSENFEWRANIFSELGDIPELILPTYAFTYNNFGYFVYIENSEFESSFEKPFVMSVKQKQTYYTNMIDLLKKLEHKNIAISNILLAKKGVSENDVSTPFLYVADAIYPIGQVTYVRSIYHFGCRCQSRARQDRRITLANASYSDFFISSDDYKYIMLSAVKEWNMIAFWRFLDNINFFDTIPAHIDEALTALMEDMEKNLKWSLFEDVEKTIQDSTHEYRLDVVTRANRAHRIAQLNLIDYNIKKRMKAESNSCDLCS